MLTYGVGATIGGEQMRCRCERGSRERCVGVGGCREPLVVDVEHHVTLYGLACCIAIIEAY